MAHKEGLMCPTALRTNLIIKIKAQSLVNLSIVEGWLEVGWVEGWRWGDDLK